jgi:UDP-GlcNAc:undecaprenyl-phosphate/decaprenyl-phosphate GlcNAc-1-phosphate transferase
MQLILFPLIAFTLNLILTPVLIRIADKRGLHDHPDDRKIHTDPVSNVGGIGFFISALFSLLIYSFFYRIPFSLFLFIPGFILIHILGILDDRLDIKARYKLIIQIVAASAVAISGVLIKIIELPFIGLTFNLGIFSYIITVFWIIAVSNAVNLIDGIDGQAGGISLIALLAIGVSHILNGAVLSALISFVFAGAVLSFLFFNYPPARIFMGDGGSLVLGFAIAVLPLLQGSGSITPLAGPLTIIMIPVLDVFASIIRRKRKGLHFFIADKEHTHHKLLDFGFSNRQILSIVYSLTILFALISIFWSLEMNILAFIMIVSAWIACATLFLILDRKYENKIRSKRRLENIRLIS